MEIQAWTTHGIALPVEEWKDRIVLPVDAVVDEGAEAYVYRQNGNHFDRMPVHVEYRDRDNWASGAIPIPTHPPLPIFLGIAIQSPFPFFRDAASGLSTPGMIRRPTIAMCPLMPQHNLIREVHLVEECVIHHQDIAFLAPKPGAAEQEWERRVVRHVKPSAPEFMPISANL